MESYYRVVLKNIYKLKCSSTVVLQKPKLIETHEKIMTTLEIQNVLDHLRSRNISLFNGGRSPLNWDDFKKSEFTEAHYEKLKKPILLLEPPFHYKVVEFKASEPFDYEYIMVTEKIASKLLAYLS